MALSEKTDEAYEEFPYAQKAPDRFSFLTYVQKKETWSEELASSEDNSRSAASANQGRIFLGAQRSSEGWSNSPMNTG